MPQRPRPHVPKPRARGPSPSTVAVAPGEDHLGDSGGEEAPYVRMRSRHQIVVVARRRDSGVTVGLTFGEPQRIGSQLGTGDVHLDHAAPGRIWASRPGRRSACTCGTTIRFRSAPGEASLTSPASTSSPPEMKTPSWRQVSRDLDSGQRSMPSRSGAVAAPGRRPRTGRRGSEPHRVAWGPDCGRGAPSCLQRGPGETGGQPGADRGPQRRVRRSSPFSNPRAQVVVAASRLAELPECRSRAGGGEGARSTVDGRRA